ncbi:MAG TPA: arylesterase [Pseudobdellovibrionaceae bacterium]|jgi:acyl-CoA thioesterase-1
MRLFLFLILLFSIAFAVTNKKLVVIGDSLTEGLGVSKESAYPALVEKKIHDSGKKNWTVINAGVSGSTTASVVGRMKWLFKSKPDLILLVMGANDGLRGLKIEESEKNLSEAIEYTQSQKVPLVLGGIYIPPNYGKDYTEKFKKMYLTLAKKYKIPLIPFVLDKVGGDPRYNQADGIHPNEAGHKIIAETVYQQIKGLL